MQYKDQCLYSFETFDSAGVTITQVHRHPVSYTFDHKLTFTPHWKQGCIMNAQTLDDIIYLQKIPAEGISIDGFKAPT